MLLLLLISFGSVSIRVLSEAHSSGNMFDEKLMHPDFTSGIMKRSIREDNPEFLASFWRKNAQKTVVEKITRKLNKNMAKNVILFLGDGMSIPTLAATRVYLGGEEQKLSFEKFPYSGLSKTYCVDKQVADSACTATAYLGGVKGNYGTVGVTAKVQRHNCTAMLDQSTHVNSIAQWSQLKGKRTGLVTTARVTHASPAGVYAHTADRDWESDSDVVAENLDPGLCTDIARQLVYGSTGQNLNVILGGGRREFLPQDQNDEKGTPGKRLDGINLIKEWIHIKDVDNDTAEYVSDKTQLLDVKEDTEYLLGLFDADHLDFNIDRETEVDPSLEEMTEAAIKVLSKGKEGYFLFVEGGRIDMAHHKTLARKALNETAEFSKAVEKAVELTNEDDTLIIITSDHAHTMSFSGYPSRGNDILGIGGTAKDNMPFLTLNYANGPSYKMPTLKDGRHDLSSDDINGADYYYPSSFPLDSETHGGDDVGVFAQGPWAHLFTGVIEENVIPHLAAFASCVGTGITLCDIANIS